MEGQVNNPTQQPPVAPQAQPAAPAVQPQMETQPTPVTPKGNKKNLKTIIIVFVLFLAGIASVLGISRVKTYLGGAQADEEPGNVQVQAQDTSATVSWQTDKAVLGTIEYGTNQASLLLRAPESQPATIHRVALSPLKSDIVYYYRIRIGETLYDNNGVPFSFRTKAATVVVEPTLAPTTTPVVGEDDCTLVKVCTQSVFEGKMGGSDCQYDFDENGTINTRDWMLCLKENK